MQAQGIFLLLFQLRFSWFLVFLIQWNPDLSDFFKPLFFCDISGKFLLPFKFYIIYSQTCKRSSIQLSPEGEVNSGGHTPRCEASRYIYLALFTDPECDSCFSICHISWIKMKRITFCKLKINVSLGFVKWFLRLLLQIQGENNFLPASKHRQVLKVSQGWSLHACWTRMLYHDRLETIENSQSTFTQPKC